jgi:hypothetical protein
VDLAEEQEVYGASAEESSKRRRTGALIWVTKSAELFMDRLSGHRWIKSGRFDRKSRKSAMGDIPIATSAVWATVDSGGQVTRDIGGSASGTSRADRTIIWPRK